MALFMLRGSGFARWCPAVVSLTAPTTAELTAGISLTEAITSITGLEPQSNKINVPIWKYKTEAQIDGPQTFQDVVITIPEDDGEGVDSDALARQAALTTLVKGAEGVLVMNRGKKTDVPASGDKVFSIRAAVGSQVPNWSLDAAAASTNINLSPSSDLTPGVVAA